jgi:hypothetical protein
MFPDLGVFCFLFIQKWNECRFFSGIVIVVLKGVRCVLNTKLTTGKLSCAIFPDLGVFCFLFIQKWNECGFL